METLKTGSCLHARGKGFEALIGCCVCRDAARSHGSRELCRRLLLSGERSPAALQAASHGCTMQSDHLGSAPSPNSGGSNTRHLCIKQCSIRCREQRFSMSEGAMRRAGRGRQGEHACLGSAARFWFAFARRSIARRCAACSSLVSSRARRAWQRADTVSAGALRPNRALEQHLGEHFVGCGFGVKWVVDEWVSEAGKMPGFPRRGARRRARGRARTPDLGPPGCAKPRGEPPLAPGEPPEQHGEPKWEAC